MTVLWRVLFLNTLIKQKCSLVSLVWLNFAVYKIRTFSSLEPALPLSSGTDNGPWCSPNVFILSFAVCRKRHSKSR